MPIAAPTYGGDAIFGINVRMLMTLNPTANQVSAFFGAAGTLNLFGGQRGRAFLVEGNFFESDIGTLAADVAQFESYVDGVGRALYDSWGRTWPQVLVEHFEPGRLLSPPQGFLLPYRASLRGLL